MHENLKSRRKSGNIDELQIISARKSLQQDYEKVPATNDLDEILDEAGTYSFHFAESWENFGLIFIKIFILFFEYLV